MKRTLLVIALVLIASALADVFWRDSYGYYAWSRIPAFYALFGLIGCVTIVLVSKWLGHMWLQKEQDYYDRSCDGE